MFLIPLNHKCFVILTELFLFLLHLSCGFFKSSICIIGIYFNKRRRLVYSEHTTENSVYTISTWNSLKYIFHTIAMIASSFNSFFTFQLIHFAVTVFSKLLKFDINYFGCNKQNEQDADKEANTKQSNLEK